MTPKIHIQLTRTLHIPIKTLNQTSRCLFTINKCRNLKILLIRTIIHISSTHNRQISIHHNRLRMQKIMLIIINLNTSTQKALNITTSSRRHNLRIIPLRYHHTHPHSRQSCRLQSIHHRFRWHIIRRMDKYLLFSLRHRSHNPLHYITPIRIWSRSNNLHLLTILKTRHLRIIFLISNNLTIHKTPIHQKRILHRMHRRSLNPHKRIAPQPQTITHTITFRQIHSPRISHSTINNYQFTMITIIQKREFEYIISRQKRMYKRPSILQRHTPRNWQFPRTKVVINHTHTHPLTRFTLQ